MANIMESRDPSMKKRVQLQEKNQITIPDEIVDQLQLKEGEDFEITIENGHIKLVPVITIEKDQAWFWTEKWQEEEREAELDLKEGRVKNFDSVKEAMDWLEDEENADDED